MRRILGLLSLLVLVPVIASAQRPQPGARIRVYGFSGDPPREAVLLDWWPEGALIRSKGSLESTIIPSNQLGQIEVFAGKRSHVFEGAVVVGGSSLLGGLAFGLMMTSEVLAGWGAGEVIGFTAGFAAMGAACGALIGLLVWTPVWSPIQDESIQVQAGLEPGAVGFSVRLRF